MYIQSIPISTTVTRKTLNFEFIFQSQGSKLSTAPIFERSSLENSMSNCQKYNAAPKLQNLGIDVLKTNVLVKESKPFHIGKKIPLLCK